MLQELPSISGVVLYSTWPKTRHLQSKLKSMKQFLVTIRSKQETPSFF